MSEEDEIVRREQQAHEAQPEPSESRSWYPGKETVPGESEPGQLEDALTIRGEDEELP